ncbi:MAG: nucleotidyltransferase family protein [Rhizobiaceae bacterium]|nr:nucleotidyltransferase family protein [Rhizobiaceae bacterium]
MTTGTCLAKRRGATPVTQGARLANLADPQAPAPATPVADREALLELARPHGVENILWRKFGADIDAPGGASTLHRIGQAMLLDGLRRELSAALAAEGVAAHVVKGPVFAEKLYAVRGDRLFSDIDLLVDVGAIEDAIRVIEGLGYVRPSKSWDNSQRDMEYKFGHPRHPTALIELHGNLVHYPQLRRRATFGLPELLAAGDGDGEAPTALLATAIVHGTLGHKLDRLVMLVDVLQAVRNLPREDFDRAVTALTALRLDLECAVCLSVVARLFRDDAVAELAERFPAGPSVRLGKMLVSPEAVVYAQAEGAGRGSWARRKTFRLLQCLPQ